VATAEIPILERPADRRSGRARPFRAGGISLVWSIGIALLVTWATAALYFAGHGAETDRSPWRTPIAAAFLAFSGWAWFFARKRPQASSRGWLRRLRWCWLAAFLTVLGWFIALRPSHDRDWKREVSVLPKVTLDGDRVRISGYRDFTYRTRDDFDVRYQEREVALSDLEGVDLFISYWGRELMAHTFLSFRFTNSEPVCVSIEARLERGEKFAALPSVFKRFELIYVLGSERDIVRVRTNHRAEEVYLYPIRVSAAAARRLFLVYVQKINRLAGEPEFYHLLSNSCTANIVRNARAAGQETPFFEGRFVLNGLVDEYLYNAALIDRETGFEEAKRRARITAIAKEAGDSDFSTRIRARLPSAEARQTVRLPP
jgi:hypothetical protein